ncbi:MAG TPA: hypothetical protein VMF11_07965 [Candidatus Baltobacteraceae bacterium]|nr:hypothetical protein [Candidatus Baltobacteraceae bacterium]
MSDYTLTVNMSTDTVQQLKANGYALHAFFAVQAPPAGLPVLVYRNPNFLPQTAIVFSPDALNVFLSATPLQDKTRLQNAQLQPIALGQLCTIDSSGVLDPPADGLPGAVTVYNASKTTYTTGLAVSVNGNPANVVALSVSAQLAQLAAPYSRAVVMLSNLPLSPGLMLAQAGDACYSVDFGASVSRQVTFDVNAGWSSTGAFASLYPPPVDLTEVLILQPPRYLLKSLAAFVAMYAH